MSTSAKDNINKLPDFCYTMLPANNLGERIGMVRAGESGYYKADWNHQDSPSWSLEELEANVRMMNDEIGVSAEEQSAMEYGSMFGWEVPAANVDNAINRA